MSDANGRPADRERLLLFCTAGYGRTRVLVEVDWYRPVVDLDLCAAAAAAVGNLLCNSFKLEFPLPDTGETFARGLSITLVISLILLIAFCAIFFSSSFIDESIVSAMFRRQKVGKF